MVINSGFITNATWHPRKYSIYRLYSGLKLQMHPLTARICGKFPHLEEGMECTLFPFHQYFQQYLFSFTYTRLDPFIFWVPGCYARFVWKRSDDGDDCGTLQNEYFNGFEVFYKLKNGNSTHLVNSQIDIHNGINKFSMDKLTGNVHYKPMVWCKRGYHSTEPYILKQRNNKHWRFNKKDGFVYSL
jgi:hypothetical protein